MYDLLSPTEVEIARSQGWGLHHVYDSAAKQWVVRIMPASFNPKISNVETAMQHVVGIAKSGDALAIKALRLMVHGPVPRKKK